ncbi:MAG TPA: hypothetical protein VNS58_00840 [Puia sp.]|nr:hypothetical protein [Puia sp.]
MAKVYKVLFFVLSVLTGYINVNAQVTIAGPTCVASGVTYQYNLSANWDSLSTVSICASGGLIMDSGTQQSCLQKKGPIPYIKVTWGSGLSTASISVTSSTRKDSMTVFIAATLVSGLIDTSVQFQTIAYNTVPASLFCSADSGGSCSPGYSYQWQQSEDGLQWVDVNSAVGETLVFQSLLVKSTYYRRKIKEEQSGTITYSNIAIVEIDPATR